MANMLDPLREGGLQVYGDGRMCLYPSLQLVFCEGNLARIPQIYWKMYPDYERDLRIALDSGSFHVIKDMTQTLLSVSFGGMWLFFYPLPMRWLELMQSLARRWLARAHAARVRRAVAVMQGLHPRLGQASPLQMLPEHLLSLCLGDRLRNRDIHETQVAACYHFECDVEDQ